MATIPSPATWTAGEVPTAAKMNTNIRDTANYLLNPPTCQVQIPAAQTLTTGTVTILTATTTVWDTDSMASAADNGIKIKTAGLYLLTGYVAYASNATGYRGALIYGNSTILASDYRTPVSGVPTPYTVSVLARLAVNDVITLRGLQTSGGNLDATTTNGAGRLSAVWQGV